MAKHKVKLQVEVPDGLSRKELRSYIGTAVTFYSKGLDPESPLWYIEVRKLKVKRRTR